MPTLGSRVKANARVRKSGRGTKSASRMETNSGGFPNIQINQGIVDVPGLGVGVVIACDVTAAMFTTKLPKPVTASIVADPDAKIRVRERHRSDDCLFQYQAVFIVGAYQDVNVWRRLACQPGQIGFDIRRTVTNPGQKKQRHGSRNHRQHFDGNENDAKGKVWRETDF